MGGSSRQYLCMVCLVAGMSLGIAACRSTPEAIPDDISVDLAEDLPEATVADTFTDTEEASEAIDAKVRKARSLFDESYEKMLRRSPMTMSYQGRKQRNAEWDDVSAEYEYEGAIIRRVHWERLKRELDLVDHREKQGNDTGLIVGDASLPMQTRLSLSLVKYQLNQADMEYKYRYFRYPINQLSGLQKTIPAFLVGVHGINDKRDAEDFIARLSGIAPLFKEIVVQLKVSARMGVVLPLFAYPGVLDDIDNVLEGEPFDYSGVDSKLMSYFRLNVSNLKIPSVEKKRLIAQATTKLRDVVKPSYEALREYLTRLRGKATNVVGVWRHPEGAEYYRYLIKKYTNSSLTARQIHQIGLREVRRNQQEIADIMLKVEFEGDLEAFFLHIAFDKSFYYADSILGREAYLKDSEKIIKGAMGALSHSNMFNSLPQAKIKVEAVESFREKSSAVAFYRGPDNKGERSATYYVNFYRMTELPRFRLQALAYGEGLPGRHLQVASLIENTGLPRFRRESFYPAYSQGWSMYGEWLAEGLGLYATLHDKLGRLTLDLLRSASLVVDTGLHAMRWERDDVISYLVENTPYNNEEAGKQVDRVAIEPGVSLSLKIGQLKLLELKNKVKMAQGDEFSYAAFHEQVLGNGPVPLNFLELQIDMWLDSEGFGKQKFVPIF